MASEVKGWRGGKGGKGSLRGEEEGRAGLHMVGGPCSTKLRGPYCFVHNLIATRLFSRSHRSGQHHVHSHLEPSVYSARWAPTSERKPSKASIREASCPALLGCHGEAFKHRLGRDMRVVRSATQQGWPSSVTVKAAR